MATTTFGADPNDDLSRLFALELERRGAVPTGERKAYDSNPGLMDQLIAYAGNLFGGSGGSGGGKQPVSTGDVGPSGGANVAAAKASPGIRAGLANAVRMRPWMIPAGAAGLGIGGLLAAGNALNNSDPTLSNEQRLGGAVGAGTLSTALGLGGAVLGAPLGPLGSLALGTAGSMFGGFLGEKGGQTVMGVLGPSPEEKALAAQSRAAQSATDNELYRLQALAPTYQALAEQALANKLKEQTALLPLQERAMRSAAMIDMMRQSQLASNQQALAATQGLFNRGIV